MCLDFCSDHRSLTVDLLARFAFKSASGFGAVPPIDRLPPGSRNAGESFHRQLSGSERRHLVMRREDGDEAVHDDAVYQLLGQTIVQLQNKRHIYTNDDAE